MKNLLLMPKKTKVFDCFTYFNEIDLLKIRLEYLYNYVDKFIIVEGNVGFQGNSKNHFLDLSEISKFLPKVHYSLVSLDAKDPWENENKQRRGIFTELKNHADLNDIVILSDLDEIWNVNILKKYIKKIYSIKCLLFYYYFNLLSSDTWYSPKIGLFKHFEEDMDSIRLLNNLPIIEGGWHFSYFGGANKIKEKLRSFSHSEYNTEKYTDITFIENKIKLGLDLFDRNIDYKISTEKEVSEIIPYDLLKLFKKENIQEEILIDIINKITNGEAITENYHLDNLKHHKIINHE